MEHDILLFLLCYKHRQDSSKIVCSLQLINAIDLHYCNRIKIFCIKEHLKRTCVYLDLKEAKNITHFHNVKGTFLLALSMQLYIMTNFAEFHLLPMMEFVFNTFLRSFRTASLLKRVSDFTADLLFVSKRSFQLDISTKKDTTKDKNINISSLK